MNDSLVSLKVLTLSVLLISNGIFAQEESDKEKADTQPSKVESFHDADPRNTQMTLGLAADQDGDMKVSLGGGGANLYGNGDYQTQTIFFAEYHLQTEQARLRNANFDERFGGIYVDIGLQDIIDMYTVGYMLPLETVSSNLLFFPSIDYTRVEFDANEAADAVLDAQGGRIEIDGTQYGRKSIADIITNIGLEGQDSSDLMSLIIYAMKPWNETHFSMLQLTSGSSYSGFDMEITDLYFMQGIRAKLGKNIVNVFAEVEYSETRIQGIETDDTKVAVGLNFKF